MDAETLDVDLGGQGRKADVEDALAKNEADSIHVPVTPMQQICPRHE